MTSIKSLTHYITTDNMKASDISFMATKHPAPNGHWWTTNKLSNAHVITLHAGKLEHLRVDNMRTAVNKAGKKYELGKDFVPLFCPVSWATMEGNRQSDSVDTVNAYILDMDGLDEQTTRSVFQRLQGVCYTAFSSYSQGLKDGYTFRLILPVSRPIKLQEYQRVWISMQKYFPENDIQTKDPARFWFYPCARADRASEKWSKAGDGGVIDIDKLLKDYVPSYPNATRPQPVRTSNPVPMDYTPAPAGQRYKVLSVPSSYPIVGADGETHPFDWYIDQWPNLYKRKEHYQCYAPGSGTLGSAFIHRSVNVWGVARYRLTCVNERKTHLDCITTDNGLELQYKDSGRQWQYLLCVDNIMEMIWSLNIDLWKCEIRQKLFTRDQPVMDVTELQVMTDLRRKFFAGRKLDLKMVQSAMALHAEQRQCNPLVDYLEGLKWDGEKRIHNTLHKYLRCDNTELNQIYSRKWMIAAVARAITPGCKVDTMPVFNAPQGHGKGTFIKIMAGTCALTGYSWYNSSPINIGHKDGQSILRTAWMHEMAELSAMEKKHANVIKNFLSDSTDTFRRAYDKYEVKVDRSSINLGSANDEDVAIFKDRSGSRRYWYIKCHGEIDHMAFDPDELIRERDQLWAEAVHAFKCGEQWWLTPQEQKMSREYNKLHTVTGIHDTLIQEFVDENVGHYFTVSDMIEQVYGARTIKPVSYPNFYPSLLTQLGCQLQNNGKRCRRNGVNRSGWYYSPKKDEQPIVL